MMLSARHISLSRLFRAIVAFQTIAALLLSVSALRGEGLAIDDSGTKRFADFLYRNGEYYRAISEYKRLLHFFPESPYRTEAICQIGRSYMAGGDIESAILYWNEILDRPLSKEINISTVHLLLGISYLDRDRLAPFRLRTGNIEKALKHLDQIDPQFAEKELARSFASDWRSRPRPEYKSPLWAGGLSALVPGAGSFYTKRFREGIYALFVTSLFYIASLEAYHRKENELFLVLGSFTVAFYGGGIYTAVNSAHKANDTMDAEALFEIRKENGFWFIPETDRIKGGL